LLYQQQYYLIYSYFKTTTEPFDLIEWDGKELLVILDDKIIENYTFEDINELLTRIL
jgi:hypothetical protein